MCKRKKKGSIKKKLLIILAAILMLSPGAAYGYFCLTSEPAEETVVQAKQPDYKAELDKVDKLIYTASSYMAGEVNIELRSQYSDRILETTGHALDILDPLSQKYPGKPDIEERLQSVYELRHAALKTDSAY